MFKALAAGVVFQGKIRVHNLRPAELGALVWALTWGGESGLRHSIGMAKPYGYGSVQVEITAAHLHNMAGQPVQYAATCAVFENWMTGKSPNWRQSEQIRSLLAMANPNTQHPTELKYPVLGMTRDSNDFTKYKNASKVLRSYIAGVSTAGSGPSNAPQHHTGETVRCVAVNKNSKGNWKFQIKGEGKAGEGSLHPDAIKKNPADIAEGKEYDLVITAASIGNYQFKWPEK